MPLISRSLLTQRLRGARRRRGRSRAVPSPRPRPGLSAHQGRRGAARRGGSPRRMGPAVGELAVRAGKISKVSLLMWAMKNGSRWTVLPDRRVVVRFDFRGVPARFRHQRTWLAGPPARRGSTCATRIPATRSTSRSTPTGSRWGKCGRGHLTFARRYGRAACASRADRELARAFPGWLQLSPFAPFGRAGAPRLARAATSGTRAARRPLPRGPLPGGSGRKRDRWPRTSAAQRRQTASGLSAIASSRAPHSTSVGHWIFRPAARSAASSGRSR
jgi:hypothetical protein